MLACALSLLLGAELTLEPGAARPGDVVLVTVTGARDAPTGRLGNEELTFLPGPAGWRALAGLGVDQRPGLLTLDVTAPGDDGRPTRYEGALTVLKPAFRRRELTVSRRFTSPSKKDRERGARDRHAFQEAFDRDFEPLHFTGGFAWPRLADLTAPFGDLRLLNGRKQSQHMGIDLDGATGDPVVAANDGEVVLVRDCFASGVTVLVHHGARLFTAYFHLSRVDVQPGQRVRRGAPLGLVGRSGRVTGPHLHFGARLDGRWVNPESLLALRFGPAAPPRDGAVLAPGPAAR
jgi:murein DD-endopeptidase MepM/ murein hydrolase activator NlpD